MGDCRSRVGHRATVANSQASTELGKSRKNSAISMIARASRNNSIALTWSGKLPAGAYEGVLTVVYAGTEIETRSLPFRIPE